MGREWVYSGSWVRTRWSRPAVLNLWTTVIRKHIFLMFLGTEILLTSKITLVK